MLRTDIPASLYPRALVALVITLLALATVGCRQDMHDQPGYEPLERSSFFENRRSGRLQVAGTVARGELNEDAHLHTGFVGEDLATTLPFPLTRTDLERGRERFDIMCSPCHGRVGDGDGMIVRRGFRRPPSYHTARLREMPPGHYFDVITNGFGGMGDFSDRLSVEDRWRIVGYIRALQLSQAAVVANLPADVRQELDSGSSGQRN